MLRCTPKQIRQHSNGDREKGNSHNRLPPLVQSGQPCGSHARQLPAPRVGITNSAAGPTISVSNLTRLLHGCFGVSC